MADFYPDQGHGFLGGDLVDAERRSRDFLVVYGGAKCTNYASGRREDAPSLVVSHDSLTG